MHKYLQPEDDGLLMRDSHLHVAEKLHYLKRYIDIFESSMHAKPWHKRHYIDLFAGPGKCYVREADQVYLGSPLLAVMTAHPFTNYFFVDKDQEYVRALEERCRSSPLFGEIEFATGDSNTIVRTIVAKIRERDCDRPDRSWPSLNLAFLDPEGLELQWTTVETLASVRRMDLIIYYPEMGLTRNLGHLSKVRKESAIDMFFGSRKWREIYARYESKEDNFIHRSLMDFYKENLATLNYHVKDESDFDEPVIRNTRQGRLYRLLFASKHPIGHKFWQQSTTEDAYGQRRLL